MINDRMRKLGVKGELQVQEPVDCANSEAHAQSSLNYANVKDWRRAQARRRVVQPNIFGPIMVHMGNADAFVSGPTYEHPDVIRPALRIFHTRQGAKRAAGAYISTRRPLSDKVRRAVIPVHEKRPDLQIDGEMQADTAIVPQILDKRRPFSRVKDLVVPSLYQPTSPTSCWHVWGMRAQSDRFCWGWARQRIACKQGWVADSVHIAAVAVAEAQSRKQSMILAKRKGRQGCCDPHVLLELNQNTKYE